MNNDNSFSSTNILPLTQNQTAIWLDEVLFPNSSMYHIGAYYEIKGAFEETVFAAALQKVISENDAFGISIQTDGNGQPFQTVAPQLGYQLPIYDFSEKENPRSEGIAWMEARFQQPFDIAQPPLYDFVLVKVGEGHYFWLMKMHHLIIDGWGYSVFTEQLVEYYNAQVGIEIQQKKQLFSFSDYLEEEHHYYASAEFGTDKTYWAEKFQTLPAPIRVAHNERQIKEEVQPVTKLQWKIPRTLYSRIETLAKGQGVSVFHFWLGILSTYFYKTKSNEDDHRLCMGIPVLNRGSRQFKNTIGLFTGMSPLLVTVEAVDTFEDLLKQIKGTLRSDYRHQRFPIQELLRSVNHLTLGERNLFEVTFSYETQNLTLNLAQTFAEITPLTSNVDKSPMSIFLRNYSSTEAVVIDFDFLSAYFPKWEVGYMIERLATLVENVLQTPNACIGDLAILPAEERTLLLETFNDTAADYPKDKTIVDLFEEQVAKTPDNIAVVFEDKQLTYSELNDKANQLAHHLQTTYNTQGDDIIALQLERSEWMIIAILGVLKSGAAYLPIGTDLPKARVEFMLQDSQAKVLLSDTATFERAKDLDIAVENVETIDFGGIVHHPSPIVNAENLAYVLYTSGSTGLPKGVTMPHRSLVNLITWQTKRSATQIGDKTVQFVPYTFDVSFQEIFATFASGGTLVLLPDSIQKDLQNLPNFIHQHQINRIFLPFVALNSLAELVYKNEKQDLLVSLKSLVTAGEQLQSSLALKTLLRNLPKAVLCNQYGPTETHVVSEFVLPKNTDNWTQLPPIGQPIDNAELLILNESLMLNPIGVAGELYIGGHCLAKSYLNNPELSAEKFIPHPFKAGERLYKTGDLARWLPDGNLEFLGRIDQQLKIRGYRIETGEIEQILLSNQAIQSAAVIGYDFENAKELVAYLVPKAGENIPNMAELRLFLGESLPDYMIPAYFVELEQFPLTSSGKVNRKALPKPDSSIGTGTAYVAPRNTIESQLADIWQSVLNRDHIGIHDNFFALGGHSLRAIRLLSLIKQQLSVDIKLSVIFARPTIADLAAQVLEQKNLHPIVLQPIPRAATQKDYALSNAQRRLWVLDQMDDNLTAYNMPAAIRLKGDLNVQALEQSFQILFDRHEVLRTRFIGIEGEGRQIIDHPQDFKLELHEVDQKAIQEWAQTHANSVFDLEKEHLLKVKLLKIKEASKQFVLLFNMHHIISDGWSMGILVNELSYIYEALSTEQPLQLAPLNIQYKDYAAWQNNLLTNDLIINNLREYWHHQLVDLLTLDLPLDYPRPAVKTYQGSSISYQFSPEITAQLNTYSQQNGATLFMTLTALVNTLLYRYTNQIDIVIGTPTAGRNHPDLHGQIGFYVNTLVLRNKMDATADFATLLNQVKTTALQAFEHELYPFDRLVEELDIPRNMSRSAVFDVMVVLQNNEAADLSFGEVQIDVEGVETNISKFDLTFSFGENEKGIAANIEYNTDLFRSDRIERMFGHLECLIQSVLENPNQAIGTLNILPTEERTLLLNTFNDTAADYPKDKTIADLFEEQVAKTPDNIAVVFDGKQLTYSELNDRSNQLAYYLHQQYDIQGDDIIALQLERSEWMIIAILGVLKSGAAYLPIGTDLPKARVRFMLQDSQAKALLSDTATFERAKGLDIAVKNVETIDFGGIVHRSSPIVNAKNLAYIIYTSGSTGLPKGVMVEHQAVLNLVYGVNHLAFSKLGIKPLHIGQVASYSFDASIQTLFGSICFGHRLYIIKDELKRNSVLFSDFITFNHIEVIDTTPGLFNVLLKGGLAKREDLSLKTLLIGGETLGAELLTSFYENPQNRSVQIYNVYGPTEATVNTSYYSIDVNFVQNSGLVPIGQPLPNYEIFITNTQLELNPIGVAGELLIGGIGLARGYLNNPELSAEKFIPHPFKAGERLYKTGDLARWLPDGNLEFLGRIDQQLKIRGYRIETGEIEQILLSNQAVQSAVVIGYDFENGKELVAYLVPKAGQQVPNIAELRRFLGESLPDYIIPSYFVELEQLPLTSSGKVNRKALPKPDSSIGTGTAYVAPRNSIESQLVDIWQSVLNRDHIGIHDNFFALGGHSLRAIRLVSLIKQQLSVDIKLNAIFATPTVAGLATQVLEQKKLHPIVLQPIPRVATQEDYALSNAQRRLWVLDQMDDNLTAYNMPAAIRLNGDLHVQALEQSFQVLFDRHEVFRTRFIGIEGEGRQIIDHPQDFKLDIFEVEEKAIQEWAQAYANCVFDLEKEHSLKVKLLKITEKSKQFVLLFNMHHIISDGWSIGILVKELSQTYAALSTAQPVQLAPLSIQYKDYAAWQNELLTNDSIIKDLRQYWQRQLVDLPTLDLPLDYPRPAVKTYQGSSIAYQFSKEITAQLNTYAQQNGATLFMTLTALVNTLLYRYTNQTDIVMGTPSAGRSHPDLHGQIGFYVNTLVLRNEMDATADFATLLNQVKTTALQAFEHELYPFDRLVEELDIPRDMSRSAVFDVMLVLQNNETADLSFGEVAIDIEVVETNISKFDLTFNFSENNGVLLGNIEYNTDLFRSDRIERMFGHLECLIQSVLENPHQAIGTLNILTTEERTLLLETFNDTAADYPKDKTIVDLFEEQVAKTPNNIAVVFENKQLTYSELNDKANQLAYYLQQQYDTQGDDIIALQLERSEWMIIAILGVLKSGAAYLPIGTDLPKARVEFMLQDSQAKALLSDTATFDKAKGLDIAVENVETIDFADFAGIVHHPSPIVNAQNLAYIIYTSGSTGLPKGVMVEHGGVVNMSLSQINRFCISADDVVLQFANYTFDAAIYEMLMTWFSGAALVVAKVDELQQPNVLLNIVDAFKVNILTLPPTYLSTLLSLDKKRFLNNIKVLITAGEAPIIEDVQSVLKHPKPQRFSYINAYGPTEYSVCISTFDIPHHWSNALVPIGEPIANTEVYVLGNDNVLQPLGIAGELCVSGAGLARGYLNNPELTTEKFIQHPFKPSERLYKTGDLARWLPDGNIEFLGRIDQQLKIRGYRIETGEIEQILLSNQAIQSAAVIGYDFENAKELVAYLVPKAGGNMPNIAELRRFLGESLPDYMIPAYFVELEQFPLTSSGKVNRKALPKPDSSIGTGTAYVAPRNSTESQLVDIWQSVLNRDHIGIYDNFFALGGHSLRAIRLLSLIKQQLSADIKLNTIFATPTVAGLAAQVLEQKNLHPIVLQPITRVATQDDYALSNAQRRLWVLDQMDDNLTAYNMPAAIRLKGDLHVQALEQSFQVLFDRHEVLRTRFIGIEGEGRQIIDHPTNFKLDIHEVEENAIHEWAQAYANGAFDLEKDHLLKVKLLKITAKSKQFVLLFNMHHIISDGWSMGILVNELSHIYEALSTAQPLQLAPLNIQYKDYAAWQNELLTNDSIIKDLRQYWQRQLVDLPTLDLPLDYPRPAVKTYQGSSISYQFSLETTTQINAYAQQNGATLFMTLTALVNTLLYRYTNQTDIVIGTPSAGRNHPDLHGQIGFYVNTLVLRNEMDATADFVTLLNQVKTTALQAFEHELYPFDRLVEELDIPRDMSRSAVFDVMIVLQNNEAADLSFGEVAISLDEVQTNISKFDLTFNFSENGGVLLGNIEYNTDLFRSDRIERMFGHLESLIQSVLENPHQAIASLNILPSEERTLLLETFNDTAADYPKDKTIVDLFEEQVAKTPHNIAVVFEGKKLTYSELNERSNQLADYLHQQYNIQGDDIIALQLERSEWMIIAILGVLKSGAVYLPIGTDLPKARVEFMLQDSKAKVLLSDTATFERAKGLDIAVENVEQIDFGGIVHPPSRIVNAKNLAYIIYTSGSTGLPKGVMVEHSGVVNMSLSQINRFGISADDVVLQFANYTFDAAISEMLMTWFSGAALVVAKVDELQQPNSLLNIIDTVKVNILTLPPTYLSTLLSLDKKRFLNNIKVLITAGEAPIIEDVQSILRHPKTQQFSYINAYGPTEYSVCISTFDIPQHWSNALVPIGQPIANTEVHILGADHVLQPLGIAGELCVSGAGLARGYLNNPELSAEKFIPHPFKAGERLYKTGDLARWLPDGNLEFLGRIDHQLKIRGYRIETGEIEQILLSNQAIQSALVIGYDFENGKELVTYLVPKAGQHVPNIAELRRFLGESLPDYMIPSYFVELEQFPLTSSGKVDRKALPKPDSSIGTGTVYVSPRNSIESQLVDIWQRVLNRENIGIHDNFFALGGHSLRAIRLLSLIKQQLAVDIKLNAIFAKPTIAGLAAQVLEQKNLHPIVLQPIPRAATQDNYALSNAQRRLWVLDQMDDHLTAYNMPAAIRLKGDLDVQALEQSFQVLFDRHEVLRTRFISIEGEGRQVIDHPQDFKLDILEVDQKAIQELAQTHANSVFDLAKEYLLKVKLLKIKEGNKQFVLLFNMHHIISDGWSISILVNELSQTYAALSLDKPIELKSLPIQYKDYAAWQNELLNNGSIIKDLRQYWHHQLVDLPTLDLPLDYPRPAVKTYQGSSISYQFSPEITAQLNAYAQQNGATLFMTLTALVNTLLYRYTNQTDIVIGTPTAGRNHPDLHGQIGFYVNTLVLRNEMDATAGFATLLNQVKTTALEAFEHELYPFDRLVEELDIPRDMSRSAVFDVMIVLQNNEAADLSFGEVEISLEEVQTNISKFDLTFNFSENDGVLLGNIEYNTDLFRSDRIERMFGHLECLIQSVLENPHQTIGTLNILPTEERTLLLETFNDTAADYPKDKTIADLFEEQVAKTPNNIAVVFESKQLTYSELNEKANQLAHHLQTTYDTQGDDIIALQFERSEWMIIAILGVLKSGAAYLPIGTDLPKARVEFMLQDSKAKVLLSDTATFERTKDLDIAVENVEQIDFCGIVYHPSPIVNAQNLAYIIYTSGSTGLPKGVMVEHGGVVNMSLSQINRFGISADDVVLQFANYTFDAAISEMLMTWFSGAALVVAKVDELQQPNFLLNIIDTFKVNILTLPPTYLSTLLSLDKKRFLNNIKVLITAGEAPIIEDVQSILKHPKPQQFSYINAYGPTEYSVCISTFDIPHRWSDALIPIGQPIANTEVYILGTNNVLQPLGIAGELCVSGAGLARGYLNNPELTAEKFIPHPFKAGERLYKTGDLARWLPDGNLEFLGRIDQQLKIRGYRIEAGEIEQILLSNQVIQSAVVIGYDFENGKELVAYLVPKTGQLVPNIAELHRFLGESLPDYMIPSYFVKLEQFPLTSSGKVNRKALPKPDSSIGTGTEYVAPRNAKEQLLSEVWQGVLRKSEISIHDNFFHVGGDSIKAIQITARLGQADWALSIKDLFAYPTIVGQANVLSKKTRVYDQGLVSGQIPLTAIQQRFFQEHTIQQQHFNQAVMLEWAQGVAVNTLEAAFKALIQHHDMLRVKYKLDGAEIIQEIAPAVLFTLETVDVSSIPREAMEDYIETEGTRIQSGFDLSTGGLIRVAVFQDAQQRLKDQVLIAIHHLAVDGVSWRILLEDLASAYQQTILGKATKLPEKSASFKLWAENIQSYAQQQFTVKDREYWQSVLTQNRRLSMPIPIDQPQEENTVVNSRSFSFSLNPAQTKLLIEHTMQVYDLQINEVLLTALSHALKHTFGGDAYTISMEGHGREDIIDLDISRTIGWFTSVFPFVLIHHADIGVQLQMVKKQSQEIPHKGVSYGLLRYLSTPKADSYLEYAPMISFNYLGVFDNPQQAGETDLALFKFSSYSSGATISPQALSDHEIDVSGSVTNNSLSLFIRFNQLRIAANAIAKLSREFEKALLEIIALSQSMVVKTATALKIPQKQLDYRVDYIHWNPSQKQNIFIFPTRLGLGISYKFLVPLLPNYSLVAFDFIVDVASDIERLAAYHQQIKKIQAKGPYVFFGHSGGANMAYDMARYMEQRGEQISDIIMGDGSLSGAVQETPEESLEIAKELISSYLRLMYHKTEKEIIAMQAEGFWSAIEERIVAYGQYMVRLKEDVSIHANIHQLLVGGGTQERTDIRKEWGNYTKGNFKIYDAHGEHMDMFVESNLGTNVELIKFILQKI